MKALFIDVIDKLQAGLARANEKKDCLYASKVEWCVLMKSIFSFAERRFEPRDCFRSALRCSRSSHQFGPSWDFHHGVFEIESVSSKNLVDLSVEGQEADSSWQEQSN